MHVRPKNFALCSARRIALTRWVPVSGIFHPPPFFIGFICHLYNIIITLSSEKSIEDVRFFWGSGRWASRLNTSLNAKAKDVSRLRFRLVSFHKRFLPGDHFIACAVDHMAKAAAWHSAGQTEGQQVVHLDARTCGGLERIRDDDPAFEELISSQAPGLVRCDLVAHLVRSEPVLVPSRQTWFEGGS